MFDRKAYARKWYLKNRRREIARVAKWNTDHPERVKENDRRRNGKEPRKSRQLKRLKDWQSGRPHAKRDRLRAHRAQITTHYAKALLAKVSGVAFASIPNVLAEVKAAEIKARRLEREIRC
jgi:hypothetical protein